ncbi:MAG: efflux RND transporter permease subunit [Bacteroidales bacterium]|nr:efflux RND transporter permease subunit [Bacteroidales bacterium]MBQ7018352.1 efflux RND transporter permease subunit [Bacteroidales bacterium]
MSLYQSAVKKPITTALIFVAVAIFGVFSLINIPIDLIPEIETNTIMVMTTYQGANASDIENNVTKPLENVLNSVSDLKHISSTSKENVSVVVLEFEYGIDIDVATNDVRDKLDMVTSMLPDNVDNPIIFKFGADAIPILLLSVTAEESTPGLYKILDDVVANPLARIGGVGTVSVAGAPQREITIYCDPHKLEAYNIPIETIAGVIGAENRNTPAGQIDVGSNTYSLRVQKEFASADEMKHLVVGVNNGRPVYLKDVATIQDGLEERSRETFNNGKKGGMIIVQKQSGANSVNISNKVMEMLPNLQKNLPSDVKIDVIVNTSDNIINTINSLVETIAITFFVVMLVVYLFLGRWRATFIIMLTIPISLLASLVYLFATGNSLNIISLSSLSIAIGMVVDDAIVVLENVTTHIERGSRPKSAAVYATNEVAISVIASTLTMLAVFLPLTMINGMTGVLFRQLGWIVSIIMIVSTIGALTLIPMLCSQMLRLNPHKGKFQQLILGPFHRFLDWLDGAYGRMLNWCARNRRKTIFMAFAFFLLVVIGGGALVKTEFFPASDNGRISITVELPMGTRQEITRDLALELVDKFMKKYPEIITCNVSEGASSSSASAFEMMQSSGTHAMSFNINIGSVEDRERGLYEICDMMRNDLAEYPQIRTFQVIAGGQSGGMGGEATVDVELYGYDFNATDRAALMVEQGFRSIPGVKQVIVSRDEYTPEFQVDFDREKIALNGLNTSTVSTYLRNRINGVTASYFREDGEEYDINIRYAPEFRTTVEDIENILIYNAMGQGIRLRDLGEVKEILTPPAIERKDRERLVTVSAVVPQGMAMSDLVAATNKFMEEATLPMGISWQLGGTYEDQQETFGDLIILMVLIIILVFIVMAAQFESLTYPFVIMFSIPFAFVGVILGFLVTGQPLNVMSMIGLIMLMGIVVKNGIVLIDYIILCRERGMGIVHAVVTSGRSRLRPVLMTTLTTVLGMVPMAIGTGEGAEMWRGLGTCVAWGLSVSTLITLVIVPVMYCVFAGNGLKKRRKAEIKAMKALAK